MPEQARHSISDALAVAGSSGDSKLVDTAREAFTTAMSASFWAGATGVLAAAVPAVILIRDRKADGEEAGPVAEQAACAGTSS